MLGADGGVIEARRDGVGGGDLAVLILQNVGLDAMQHAEVAFRRAGEARGVAMAVEALAAGLDTDHGHVIL